MALTDDYEGVRMAGLKIVHVMAEAYPEEQVMDDSGKIWSLKFYFLIKTANKLPPYKHISLAKVIWNP